MELEGQEGQEGQEAPAQEQPQQPEIDPRLALEIAARQFNTTPDYLEGAVRLQDENRRVSEENRRRQRELEIDRAKIEALQQSMQRFQPQEPTYDVDPAFRPMFDKINSLERLIMEERQEKAKAEQRNREVAERATELDRNYHQIMRGLPSQSQVDKERFFGAMAELYPPENGDLPAGISPERAAYATARFLGINVNGSGAQNSYQRPQNLKDPRASIVIPGGSTGPGGGVPANDTTRRSGETDEQYSQRLLRMLQESGFRGLSDGQRISSV